MGTIVNVSFREQYVAFAEMVKSDANTVTVSSLLFTEIGLEALGNPTNLCKALNGREFVLEPLDAQGTSYRRCVAANPQNYLTPFDGRPSQESVKFHILADVP